MDPASLNGVEDMTRLTDLFEGSLLRNLRIRFQADAIYVRDSTPPSTSVCLLLSSSSREGQRRGAGRNGRHTLAPFWWP